MDDDVKDALVKAAHELNMVVMNNNICTIGIYHESIDAITLTYRHSAYQLGVASMDDIICKINEHLSTNDRMIEFWLTNPDYFVQTAEFFGDISYAHLTSAVGVVAKRLNLEPKKAEFSITERIEASVDILEAALDVKNITARVVFESFFLKEELCLSRSGMWDAMTNNDQLHEVVIGYLRGKKNER